MKDEKDIFDYLKRKEVITPDKSYFDGIADKVIAARKPKTIPLYRKPQYWVAAAAAIVFIVLIFGNLNGSNPNSDVLAELDNIPDEELLAYVNDNIEEFDLDIIVENIPENSLDDIDYNLEIESIEDESFEDIVEEPNLNFDDIDNEDILKYLEEEDISLDDINISFI